MAKKNLKSSKSVQALVFNIQQAVFKQSASKLSACILVCALSACQSTTHNGTQHVVTPHLPDWVTSVPQNNAQYIYGAGISTIKTNTADATKAAQESARIEVVKSISVNLAATTQINQQADDTGRFNYQLTEQINNRIPELELSALVIKETFIDEAHNTVYALAELDKTVTVLATLAKISDLDDTLITLDIKQSQTSIDKLSKAIKIKSLQSERARYNQLLAYLGQHKQPLDDIHRKRFSDANFIFNTVNFTVTGNLPSDLADKLIQAVTDQGIRVTHGSSADLVLNYSIKWRDLTRNDTFYSIALATVKLQHQNKTLSTMQQKAKGVSSDEALARDKAIEKLGQKFSLQLSKELLSTLQ